MTQFRNKVTILSFILAALIVLRHSLGIGIYNMPSWLYILESFVAQGTDIVVPVFFALSGFLFFTNLNWKEYPRKLKTRVKSLFVPYIIWNLIGLLSVLVICQIPQLAGKINTVAPSLELGTLLKNTFWYTEYNITWFIKDLMIFILVSPVFKLLSFNRLLAGVFLVLVLLAGYYFKNSILLYASSFFLGAYACMYFDQYCRNLYSKNLVYVAGVLLLASIIVQTYMELPQGASIIWLRLLQIPLVWIVADTLRKDSEPSWWLKTSFLIYVCHHIILEPIEKCLLYAFGNNTVGAIIDILFAPTITILIIIFISNLLKKYTPRLYAIINGGRS